MASAMWFGFVRFRYSKNWSPIFAMAGEFAERDARRRFDDIRARLDGQRNETENVHVPLWQAIRLCTDEGHVIAEHTSTLAEEPTQH